MGPTHKTKYKEGDRVNEHFILIENYCRKSTVKGKNIWLWKCRCDCGNEFEAKEHTLINRFGCHSCTNKKTSTETALRKKKGVVHSGLKNRLLKDYKAGASKRGLDFELTFEEFVSIMEQDCHYCGASPEVREYELQYMQKTQKPWAHNGVDRVDSNKGYTIDNVVPCCPKCNYAKHEMTEEEFKIWIERIYKHYVLGEKQNKEKTVELEDEDFTKFPQFHVYRNSEKKEE